MTLPDPPPSSTRERLVAAAFDLYRSQGFERSTIDQIAAAAGVSRATYFRHFPNKESVVFPDHDAIAAAVEARLDAARSNARGDVSTALHEAAAIVLRHYLAEGELARQRYLLTRRVAPLRDAEIAGQLRYQRLFRRHLERWFPAAGQAVLVEVLANAVVTAHNHVLRDWLRGHDDDPEPTLAGALAEVIERLWPDEPDRVERGTSERARGRIQDEPDPRPNARPGGGTGSRVLVFDSSLSPEQVLAQLSES